MPLLRLALPPSLPSGAFLDDTRRLSLALAERCGMSVDVVISRDYDALRQAVVTGAVDAALAPPFVCAQVQSHVRVPLQVVRRGHSEVAAAFVVRADPSTRLVPRALRAAWVDPASVCGHLLPKAWLRVRKVNIERYFVSEAFFGSYAAALRAVVAGDADVCGLHVLPGGAAFDDAVTAHAPECAGAVRALAVTDAVPGDGVAVSDRGLPLAQALVALPADLLWAGLRADALVPAPKDAWAALSSIASPEL